MHSKRLVPIGALAAAAAAVAIGAVGASAHSAAPPKLTVTNAAGRTAHVMLTPSAAKQLPALSTDLTYHGGPIMTTAKAYLIFWLPSSGKLQDGTTATSLSSTYKRISQSFVSDYGGHSLANDNTQYSQVVSGTTTYGKSTVTVGGTDMETSAYPTSGCASAIGPNCITDAQIEAEVAHAMSVKGWVSDPTHIFILFTSKGENSCFDSSGSECAYTQYCAYHSYFGSNTIYANMPYADSRCQAGFLGQHFPNSPDGDASANLTSHELTEAITDPLINAWYDSNGEEIGDKCAWNFGSASWDSGLANEMWNGHFYDVQLEYDNHTSSCVTVGP